jgi:2-polyprenyl-6-methoxyphenol hydroxylase-like FAD-dependent oxidoreductase
MVSDWRTTVTQVWDEGGNGYVRYSAGNVGLANMGYVAENRVLQAALMRRLKDFKNSTLFWPVRTLDLYISDKLT